MRVWVYVASLVAAFGAGWLARAVIMLPDTINEPYLESMASLPEPSAGYVLPVTQRSFFALDAKGETVRDRRAKAVRYVEGENTYVLSQHFVAERTALIVMDPWQDMGSAKLNAHFQPVYKDYVLPLVQQAIALGMHVYVLTNDPAHVVDPYNSAIADALAVLASQGKLTVLYHQDYDAPRFAERLKAEHVDTLIYSGFASNLCVIGRELGLIRMRQLGGFRLYFVPEASAALEYGDSWKTQDMHHATTTLISQWVGSLIAFDDMMKLKPNP